VGRDGDVLAIVANILTEIPPPIKGKTKDVPSVVDETIMRALTKDPNGRFATMAHVADALEPFASTNTNGERVRVTPSQQSREMEEAAFAATTKVPTTVTVPPTAETPTTPPPEVTKRRGWQLAVPLFLLGALGAAVYLSTKKDPPSHRASQPSRRSRRAR